MKTEFNINVWDISKSIAAILLVIFVLWRVPSMFDNAVDKFSKNKVDETIIANIAVNAVRVQLAESDKDLKLLINELKSMNKTTMAAIESNDEKIKELGVVVSSIGGNSSSSAGSIVHEDPVEPEKTLVDTLVYTTVGDNEKLPTARVFYSPNAPKEVDRWGTQAFPLDYYTTIYIAEDEDGNSSRYVEAWIQNDFIPSSRGKKYPIDIKEVKWAKGKELDKKFRFHTRLGFTGAFNIEDFYPAIDLSLLSYGRTKRDMDWRFLDFVIGGNNENIYFGITPISYNLGNFMHFIQNTFVGASIVTDEKLDYSYGLSISVPF